MGGETGQGFYQRFLVFTIAAVCLLILAGGVVRSTGSGMGCPDWPKCFGSWVPPVSIDQLPPNYKEMYSLQRHEKNLRLAGYLEVLGYSGLAEKLRSDESILQEATFNPTKTWIEYMNRLLGVIIGFLVFFNIVLAFPHRQWKPLLLWLAVINFVLVGFQGWVGSVVVSTNLLGGIITFHMALALLILAVLIYNYWVASGPKRLKSLSDHKGIKRAYVLIIASLVLFTIQVILGTQVRESIDLIAARLGQGARAGWIAELGITFYIHRSYSIVIFIVHVFFAYTAYKIFRGQAVMKFVYALLGLLTLEVLSGTVMAYFAIPPALQPVHLLLATLIFGIDVYLLLQVDYHFKLTSHKAELNDIQR